MKNYKVRVGFLTMSLILFFTITPVFAQEEEAGDLWLVEVESVSPSNVGEYTQWGKDFKALAQEANFQSFFVASANNEFSYAWNIGKSYSGLEELEKKLQEWGKADPKLGELYTKYAHTLIKRTRFLWRHMPKYSYNPDGYDGSQNTYARHHQAWIKEGKWTEAIELLAAYQKVFVDAGISTPFNVLINVFGTDTNCILFRQTFKDPADWAASMKEFEEKTNSEEMQELYAKWTAVIIKGEDSEYWINSELTHIASN